MDWRCELLEAPWAPRRYHTVASFDEKLWVIAGCNFGGADAAAQRGPIEDPRSIDGGACVNAIFPLKYVSPTSLLNIVAAWT